MAERLLYADVVIVGGGIAGTAIARELSQYELDVILLEKEIELCFGVTKATHSFIHCGLPEEDTPLINKLSLESNPMFNQLCKELDVPFMRVGKLYTVMNKNEIKILEKIKEKGDIVGVPNLEIVNKEKLREMEPNITDKAVAALYTPTTGLVSPWELVIALAENAMENKVKIMLNTKVTQILPQEDDVFIIKTNRGFIKSKFLINAAGLFADEIANMIGEDNFVMIPLKEEWYILDERITGLVNHLIRSPITGDFISPTKKELAPIENNIIMGCVPQKIKDKTDATTSKEGFKRVFNYAKEMFPSISAKDIITSFAGSVPLNSRTNDYIIEPSQRVPKFINAILGGIGVTASPAMAKLIVEILISQGLKLIKKQNFNPYRKGIPDFRTLPEEERKALIAKDPRYGHVVCRCETVTEGEIVEAIRRGARTVDGVKYRTKAGMGRCQGGFCGPRVIEILARELNIPVTEVTKKGNNSRLLLFKSKELLRKNWR